MGELWVLLLLILILAESFASTRELLPKLKNGEISVQSVHCRSGCCQRYSRFSEARCIDKAAENQECSQKHLYGIYFRCPCESGLTCDGNTDYGICQDPA